MFKNYELLKLLFLIPQTLKSEICLCNMINPIQASLLQADGSERYVIIEPILDKDDRGQLAGTGQYKIYKDAFGDQTLLFTEPNESLAKNDLPDSANPDYLGSFSIDAETGEFIYEGMVILTDDELQQAGKLILNKLDSGTSYNS